MNFYQYDRQFRETYAERSARLKASRERALLREKTAQTHLESAASLIRAASREFDAAARLSPQIARALDEIKAVQFVEEALAKQIEELIT